jgi:hypothetical protein
MKKKILGLMAIIVIAAVAAVNVSISSETSDLSLSGLINTEALGSGETTGGTKVYKDSSGDCRLPCTKTWRSCPSGNDLSTCSASDCC